MKSSLRLLGVLVVALGLSTVLSGCSNCAAGGSRGGGGAGCGMSMGF
jgi:hypothetical protein